MSTEPLLVLCMKWGTLYGADDVNRLAAGVRRHLDRAHRFICFTEDASGLAAGVEAYPLPELGLPAGGRDTRWRKLALFREDLFGLEGTALFLDLDLVVVADLGPFFDLPGTFLIIRDDDLFRFKPLRKIDRRRDRFLRRVGNSSVYRYEIGKHGRVLDAYLADPTAAAARYANEQEFLSAEQANRGILRYWPKGWCVSFKNDCVPRGLKSYVSDPSLPDGARIVLFAGHPKLSEVVSGGGHKWYRRIGRIDWLRRAWSL